VWHAREIVVQSGTALRVERFLTRHFAVRVLCGSQAIADQLDARNTVVVYDTPDPSEFAPERAGAFRRARAIPDDVALVGFVGRIDTWKGLDVLLDAWPAVKAAAPAAHLVVAGPRVRGKEDYAASLSARAAALADVHWLGEQPASDVGDLYADLDVLVVPSTEPEPYGLVVTEALASGTPVVATDAGGVREIVAHVTQGAAQLVPPRDPRALADAIRATVAEHGPSTTSSRRARRSLLTLPPGDVAEVLRAAAAGA
jgi:glycosyltransferase involved in cell wall biosynthesis